MSTSARRETPHLRDSDLVRLIDGEPAPAERPRWDSHLASCARCRGQVERLRSDAEVVRAWIGRAAFEAALPQRAFLPPDPALAANAAGTPAATPAAPRPVPPRAAAAERTLDGHARRRARSAWQVAPPWLRAAAVLVLVAAPVAAIPGLRGWVTDTIAELRPDVALERAAEPAAAGAYDAAIRFAPARGSFSVQFDAAQHGGTLRVGRTDGAEAVLEIHGPAGDVPVVSAAALRISNTPQSSASYVLQVPAAVTSVTVRVGTRTVAVFDAAALRAGVELPVKAD
jgi:anti-sigma factor RsiW